MHSGISNMAAVADHGMAEMLTGTPSQLLAPFRPVSGTAGDGRRDPGDGGQLRDPSLLEGLAWLSCYLMTGKHMAFYLSFLTVLILLAITAPVAILFGLLGAVGSRARLLPVRLLGRGYISIVRGVPDIDFFLFVPIALDQGFEYLRHRIMCPDVLEPVRGNDFVVCTIAKLPLNSDPQWLHEIYGFALAVLSFAIVFGAFAGNTFRGAFEAVPRNQLETAEAYGMNRLQVFWRCCCRRCGSMRFRDCQICG